MIKVNVMLAEGFEEIEALTVVDLLRRAQIYVSTVSLNEDYQVEGAHGISVQADELWTDADFEDVDMVVLPGGMPGTLNLKNEPGVRRMITDFAENGRWVAAICAAPTILSAVGLTKGRKISCYPSVEDDIKGAVIMPSAVTRDDNIITSRGMGTAIDFGLELIAVLAGRERAENIAESIVYKK